MFLQKNGQEELPGPPATQDREDGVFPQTQLTCALPNIGLLIPHNHEKLDTCSVRATKHFWDFVSATQNIFQRVTCPSWELVKNSKPQATVWSH